VGACWIGWATQERVTFSAKSHRYLNPYNHSGSLVYGMWQHIFEPLVEVAITQCATESWLSLGNSRKELGVSSS
jgi:hypothetical protein